MISLAEARAHVLERVSSLPPTRVSLDDVAGLVLAEPLVAAAEVPPFDNSAMDGFAVRSHDVSEPGAVLSIAGTIAAGAVADRPLEEGHAYRIMTGAPLPAGADTIAMVELCSVSEDGSAVTIAESIPADRHIRRRGGDMAAGQHVLDRGVVASPAVLGLLATLGISEVMAYPRPLVGVFSTGDELVDPAGSLGPGQIYDSNRRALVASVRAAGFDAVDLGLIPDDESAIRDVILAGAGTCDALVSSGGVSMGDFDFVKKVLDEVGDMAWMQVAIKPAKPLAFGRVTSGDRVVPVFGLPGNPVSSLVSFEVFTRPALAVMASHPQIERWLQTARLEDDLERNDDGKVHFVRVIVSDPDDSGVRWARSAGGQSSHQMASMAVATGLAVLPPGDGLRRGDVVDVMSLP